MPADGEVASAGGCRARKVLLASVALGVLVAGGVTAGLVFGLANTTEAQGGNPLQGSGTGVHVSTIATKTGGRENAGSDARLVVEICDNQGTCCQTSSDGLENPGQDRNQPNRTDVYVTYTNTTILGNCAQEGSLVGEPATAKLTASDPHGTDGLHVEWMRITMSSGEVFSCPVGGWLDNGSDAAGPGSRTVNCTAVSGVGELHSGHLCPQTSAIESEEDCRNAAKLLQIPFAHAWDGPNDFPGCLVANDGRNKTYFNVSPHPSSQANNPRYGAICSTRLALRTRAGVGVLGKPDFVSVATPHAKSEDATFSLDDMKSKCGYDNMDLGSTCTLLSLADGSLTKATTYSAGYIESAIKITKNLVGGPKIQYLNEIGIMKINSGKTTWDKIDFGVFGAEASVFASGSGAGYSAKVKLSGGKVSIFELQLALGLSSQVGIVDDSLSLKVLGIGGSVGRHNKICVFDTCFGIDLPI